MATLDKTKRPPACPPTAPVGDSARGRAGDRPSRTARRFGREIAEAAGVSEALLYKHFPSKQALYAEALAEARRLSQFTISRFATLTPGIESFVLLSYATIDFILFGFPGQRRRGHRHAARCSSKACWTTASMLAAMLADTAASWMDYVNASYRAAIAAGDIVALRGETPLRFRFVQQLGMALRLSHCPRRRRSNIAAVCRSWPNRR